MRGFGGFLSVAGVLIVALGFAMDPSVATSAPMGRVFNLSASAIQIMVVITGLAVAIAGVVLVAGGEIVAAIDRGGRPVERTAAAAGSMLVSPGVSALRQMARSTAAGAPLLKPGARVGHPLLGRGVVAAVGDETVTVTFDDGGSREVAPEGLKLIVEG